MVARFQVPVFILGTFWISVQAFSRNSSPSVINSRRLFSPRSRVLQPIRYGRPGEAPVGVPCPEDIGAVAGKTVNGSY